MKLEKENMRKGIALLMGIVMIATIFAAIPMVSANPHGSETNNWTLRITADGLTEAYYSPGEQDVSFTITIENVNQPGEADTDDANDCTLSISTDVRDTAGNVVESPISDWGTREDGGSGTNIANGASHEFGPFQFDIAPDAAPGNYRLYVTMAFTDSGDNQRYTFTGWVQFRIYDVDVSNPNALYAGQKFVPVNIDLDDNGNGIHDVYMNLTNVPSGIHFDQTTGWVPGGIPATIGYRADVDSDMSPGIYDVSYQLQYTNDHGARATQTGTLQITVEFTPVISAQLTGNEITVVQGNSSIPAMGITFTNDGNVDLRNIEINLAYDGTFFFAPASYYEGNGGSDEQNPVQVNSVEISSLGVGESSEGSWYVALNPYIQAGEHKILFTWSATYFDDGATGHATHYVDVQMNWFDDDWDDSTPLVPMMRFNHGFGWGFWMDWMSGPYVMINVVDDHPDLTAENLVNEETGRTYFDISYDNLMDVDVSATIHNFELVKFAELKATLQVGAGTPFWNPMDHSATTVENDMANSDDSVAAGGNALMWWKVDINPNTHPGMYTVYITLSGRNADTTEYMNTTIPVSVQVRGIGPVLMITSVVNGDVEPGKIFYMNLTITNQGDDTARNVFVMVPGAFGSDWEVIDGFVDAISSYNYTDYGANHERNVSSNGITLEQLNINDAKDIVDLSLYIEGVYNPPSPEVWFIMADNVAPGESINVAFKMMTNINMVKGRPYEVDVFMGYSDSYGDDWMMVEPITIRTTDPGTPYHGETDAFAVVTSNNVGLLMLFILFLIFIVLVIGLSMMKGDKEDKKKPVEPAPVQPEFVEPVEGAEAPPAEEVTEGESLVDELETTEEPIEPGFTAPEDEAEPDFSLEEKDEGESSF